MVVAFGYFSALSYRGVAVAAVVQVVDLALLLLSEVRLYLVQA